MNREQYLAQRKALLDEAEKAISDEKTDVATEKMQEVEGLDNSWEKVKLANANMNALKDKSEALDLENKSIENHGGRKMEEVNVLASVAQVDVAATPDYRNGWLKKLQGKELSALENAAVTASSAIPTETWNKIVEKAEKISPIIGKITMTNIAGNVSIPVEDSTADAAWVAMATASTDSADTLGSVTLSAYKLIKTVEIGADVQAMAIVEFEAYIVSKLSKKIAKAVENAILNGTGSGQPTGLAYTGIVTNVGTFTKAGMTYADLLAIIADLPDAGYRDNGTLVMPSALFYSDVLPALTDKGSGLDVQAVEKMKVLNYDVVLSDRLAADTILFGDFSYYHFNWSLAPEITSDKSVAFRSGSVVYRALGLADGKPTNVAAFNKYTRALS